MKRTKTLIVVLFALVSLLVPGLAMAAPPPPPVPTVWVMNPDNINGGVPWVFYQWKPVAGATGYIGVHPEGTWAGMPHATLDDASWNYDSHSTKNTYRVQAVNADGEGDWGYVTALGDWTAPTAAPATPTVYAFVVSDSGTTKVAVETVFNPGATPDKVRLYRDGVLLIDDFAPSYYDETVSNGGTYTYTAEVYNDAGVSARSAPVTLTASSPVALQYPNVSGDPPQDPGMGPPPLRFNMRLGGLGTQIGTMLTSLSPIFLAVVATVIAAAALKWGVGMFRGAFGGGRRR